MEPCPDVPLHFASVLMAVKPFRYDGACTGSNRILRGQGLTSAGRDKPHVISDREGVTGCVLANRQTVYACDGLRNQEYPVAIPTRVKKYKQVAQKGQKQWIQFMT